MRSLFLRAAVVMLGVWAIDFWAFDGRLRNEASQRADTYGAMFRDQVRYILTKLD
jgi:hypothetical protein